MSTAAQLPERPGRPPRSGEFFAPVPLAFVALLLVNDNFLKPTFHSEVTGKLSDIAVCFFMPLFLSELLGIAFGMSPRTRLWLGAVTTAALYVGLEIVAPFTRFAIHVLGSVGPYVGIRRGFAMTSDWTDLLCLPLIPLAVLYGRRRLSRTAERATRASDLTVFGPSGIGARGSARPAGAARGLQSR